LFSSIAFPKRSFNEAFSSPGQPRDHWHQLVTELDGLGTDSLKKNHGRARQMRHEDGATVNPFDEPARKSTSWDLDPIPIVIGAAEWRELEAGLIQRAQLLEMILADVYGPQNLLRNRQLPVELVFANPNFLYACHDIRPLGKRFLPFYAADLYRAEDGRFRVFRDHADNPAGLGYALENRIVMSRIFSELYHKARTHRLAPFFKTFHQALAGRAAPGHGNPDIVLLSPGPDSHIYFEHAFLSRYLGFPLVEPQDLTVRNGKIFLKKLAGLEPVEAIFRHLDDLSSDPFTLRRETAEGIAGLIQVSRENHIEIVNPIGSGFVDTPALSPFLPSLCNSLLGQNLLLENHLSWWCGTAEGLNQVLGNINGLTLGHAYRGVDVGDSSGDPSSLVQAAPARYVASTPFCPSVAPGWNRYGMSGSRVLLRAFVCATDQGFAVLPGGLGITAADVKNLIGNTPELQYSKDVWVLSDEPVEQFSLMERFHAIHEFKRSSDLPSRVADHLFWLGRYLERTEGLVRLLRLVFQRISGEDRLQDIPEIGILLRLLRAKNIVSEQTPDKPEIPPYQELFNDLINGLSRTDGGNSVVSLLRSVQNSARKVRDRLSLDSSRIINHLEDLADTSVYDPLEFLDDILLTLSSFSGLAMESMTRGLGWRFMDIGRRLERALHQTGMVCQALPLVCGESGSTLQTLLEISDSTMTYRARYRSAFQLAPVLDLLLADEGNPKSLAFQLNRIVSHMEHLPRQSEKPFAHQEERLALKMLTAIRLVELHEVHCREEQNRNDDLNLILTGISADLKEFSQQISGHYLARVQTTPHFAVIAGDRQP
jgi:uncharacterized circularly permuted ATP-grasp superfamily protein/uncharacterized alpha-E superfamily protein